MTQTSISEQAPQDPTAVVGRRRRSRRDVLVVVGGVALLLVGFFCWRLVAGARLDKVDVQVSGVTCDGTTVRNSERTTIVVSKDMRCRIAVEVHNRGTHGITARSMRATIMGPNGGAVIHAESIDGAPPHGDIDAVQKLDRSVAGGDVLKFDIVVVFNPKGCNGPGTLEIYNFPQVKSSALGVGRMVGGSRSLFFKINGPSRGCPPGFDD